VLNSRQRSFSLPSLFLTQSPSQLLENFRRQSVEGLALPFLANWLLGTVYTLLAIRSDTYL